MPRCVRPAVRWVVAGFGSSARARCLRRYCCAPGGSRLPPCAYLAARRPQWHSPTGAAPATLLPPSWRTFGHPRHPPLRCRLGFQ
ncbi:hypothetical protein E2562_017801 [Oryza meyeriana var. granulata]|uniref:Uncharacterized protein n=1 Tax=Oryza meyeriana var. granulata TaxID=110450 RepID=A0A6G1BLL8_9ORYZ|nr:hypothetical protein E2562_017801 [Oryza meyeriana var. granulata]